MGFLLHINKQKNDWWRWVVILIVFFAPFLNKQIAIYVLKPLLKIVGSNGNLQLSVLLFRSVVLLIIFYLLFKLLHRRSFTTLITGRKKIDWLRYFFGFTVWATLIVVSFTVSVLRNPENFVWNFNLYSFLELCLLLIVLVPLQVLFNEVLLHGYVYQLFGKIFKGNRIFLIVLIVLLSFYDLTRNSFILKAVGYQILIVNVAVNLVITLSTYLDNGIETVLGMKTANNFIGLLYVVSITQPIKHSALFLTSAGTNVFMFVYYTALIACPIYLIILSKLYRWDWGKLFNKNKEHKLV